MNELHNYYILFDFEKIQDCINKLIEIILYKEMDCDNQEKIYCADDNK